MKNLKAKIKLELQKQRSFIGNLSLVMLIKLNGEFGYNHKKTILSNDEFKFMSNCENFYDVLYDFITDNEQIIKKGEEFMKDILKDKLKNQKRKDIEKILENFKPIEIEVEE